MDSLNNLGDNSLTQLRDFIDKLAYEQVDKIYELACKWGVWYESPEFRHRDSNIQFGISHKTAKKLIQYYCSPEREEYEKCAELKRMIDECMDKQTQKIIRRYEKSESLS